MESNYLKWLLQQEIRYNPNQIISSLIHHLFLADYDESDIIFDPIFLNTVHDQINYYYLLNTKVDKVITQQDIINNVIIVPLLKVWWIGNLEPNLLQAICMFIEYGYITGATIIANEFFADVVNYLAEVNKRWIKSYRNQLKMLLTTTPRLYPYFRKGGAKYLSVIKLLTYEEFEPFEYELLHMQHPLSAEGHLHKLARRNWNELHSK